jgi:hypothetical protein
MAAVKRAASQQAKRAALGKKTAVKPAGTQQPKRAAPAKKSTLKPAASQERRTSIKKSPEKAARERRKAPAEATMAGVEAKVQEMIQSPSDTSQDAVAVH